MDFVRKTPPSSGQVVDFKQLIRETLPIYGQTELFESTIFSNLQTSGQQIGKRTVRRINKVSLDALLLGMTTSASGNL